MYFAERAAQARERGASSSNTLCTRRGITDQLKDLLYYMSIVVDFTMHVLCDDHGQVVGRKCS